METPPSILVGFRPNHEEEDLQAAKKLHEDIGCPLSEEDLRMLYLASSKEGIKQLEKEIQNMDLEQLTKLILKMGI